MRRFLICLIILTIILSTDGDLLAQGNTRSERGLPPIASLINVSSPDENGIVTISGAVGAVFPGAQVIVRNLYTGETAYVPAGITGSFNMRIYGPGRTPFRVSAAAVIPPQLRDWQGTLPGGPGVIIYGNVLESFTNIENVTRLVIDGDLQDWETLTVSLQGEARGFLNNESIYLAIQHRAITTDFVEAAITILVDGADYTLTFKPDNLRRLSVEQTAPTRRNRGEFAANIAIQNDVIEIRAPLQMVDSPVGNAQIISLMLWDETGTISGNPTFESALPIIPQIDGALYVDEHLSGGRVFSLSGVLGGGANRWSAQGRVNNLQPSPGDELVIDLDVTLHTPDLALTVQNLTFSADLILQSTGVSSYFANNGWSSLLTPGGLAIDNVFSDFVLATTETSWTTVTRKSNRLILGLQFKTIIPDDLPEGIYTPAFIGYVQQANGTLETWVDSAVFGAGNLTGLAPITRLPITLNIGDISEQRLPFALFYDTPSNGVRGVLPAEDIGQYALSNRVKFNTDDYILPPGNYPLEPYLPNMMANRHDLTLSPLVPFLFPAGRLNARITRPDGTVEDLGSAPIVQASLSTDEIDERDRFGVQSPLDMLRLNTLNPSFSAYNFSSYGTYTIEMSGTAEDIWGNRYRGGGTYTVTIAEPVALLPGVLPGTPFEVGDAFYTGMRLIPAVPADITVHLRVYPLEGDEVIEYTLEGKANRHGYFIPDADNSAFLLESAGEYIADYAAIFSDTDGRVWAANLRGAGVIASPEPAIIAHGQRGLSNYTPLPGEPHPAWFTTVTYPPQGSTQPVLNAPYHRGDIAIYANNQRSGMKPFIQVQDLNGVYGQWLLDTIPDFSTSNGHSLSELVLKDSLPLIPITSGTQNPYQAALFSDRVTNNAYGYISAVRPGLSLRQYIHGGDQDSIRYGWYADDSYNDQMGAGASGDRPADYTFIFGGAIIRNTDIDLNTSAIYASVAAVGTDAGNVYGTRVNPPYRGAMGTLFRVRDTAYEAFFTPTSITPGQAISVGEQLIVTGQSAPTLQSLISVTVTAPDGTMTTFSDETNSIGYFYSPENNLLIDQEGVWRVRIVSKTLEATSEGIKGDHLPEGTIPGTADSTIMLYATGADSPPLVWSRGGNIDTFVPAGGLINFSVSVPSTLSEFTPYYTVSTPSYVLEQGVLRAVSPAVYQYSPPQLAQLFSMLETNTGVAGMSGSDMVTISFAIEGMSEDGERQLFTRTFHILHDRLISIEAENDD